MQVLEKILEEITDEIRYYKGEYYDETMIYGIESNKDYKAKGIVEGLCKARTIICSHMSDNGWIPVEERLPTKEEYLKNGGRFMLDDGNRRYQGLFDIYDGKFKFSIHISGINYELFDDKGVVAWQPLPAPYQPEKGGTA